MLVPSLSNRLPRRSPWLAVALRKGGLAKADRLARAEIAGDNG